MLLKQKPLTRLSTESPNQEKKRFLTGPEMLASQILPVTAGQARKAMAPKLDLSNLRSNQSAHMADNSMSVPCVAAMLLVAMLALEQIP